MRFVCNFVRFCRYTVAILLQQRVRFELHLLPIFGVSMCGRFFLHSCVLCLYLCVCIRTFFQECVCACFLVFLCSYLFVCVLGQSEFQCEWDCVCVFVCVHVYVCACEGRCECERETGNVRECGCASLHVSVFLCIEETKRDSLPVYPWVWVRVCAVHVCV